MKNAATRLLHGVVLLVHNTREPNRKEWDDYLAAVVTARDAVGRDLARFRQIVITDGGGPNPAQRKALAEILEDVTNVDQLKVAIVSRNFAARGIATAFRWLGFPVRAFDPDQLDEAFSSLAISSAHEAAICAAIEELCSTVDGTIRSAAKLPAHRLKIRNGSSDAPGRGSVAPTA
jgi:hypothetical protein